MYDLVGALATESRLKNNWVFDSKSSKLNAGWHHCLSERNRGPRFTIGTWKSSCLSSFTMKKYSACLNELHKFMCSRWRHNYFGVRSHKNFKHVLWKGESLLLSKISRDEMTIKVNLIIVHFKSLQNIVFHNKTYLNVMSINYNRINIFFCLLNLNHSPVN